MVRAGAGTGWMVGLLGFLVVTFLDYSTGAACDPGLTVSFFKSVGGFGAIGGPTRAVSPRSRARFSSSTALCRSVSRTGGYSLIVNGRAGLELEDRDVGDRSRLSLRLLDDRWLLVELLLLLWRDELRRDGLRLLLPLLLPSLPRLLPLLPREVDLLLPGLLLLLSQFSFRLDGY